MNLFRFAAACALLFQAGAAIAAATPAPACQSQPVHEERFIRIGGIEQWVTIHGADCRNPVVLFIHGGPGNPMTPYAAAIYGPWEKDFTLVQWDQRGAGKTFTRNPGTAEADLSLELMARDGVELAAVLTAQLQQPRLLLVGGSWGSALSVHMAKSRPALFSGYVGSGQIVNGPANLAASYNRVLQLARAADDAKTVAGIEALGPPPWSNPRSFGVLRRATRVYEAKATTPAPKAWWTPSPAYATPEMEAGYVAGEDYSFVQFVGMQGDGMLWRIDLPALGTGFEMPVVLIHGEHDLVMTADVAKAYFDRIQAPRKEWVLLPLSGHDPNEALVAAQYAALKSLVAPAQ